MDNRVIDRSTLEIPTVNDKAAALGKLYDRVTRIAEAMGGTASHQVWALIVPGQMTAGRQSENAPALIAEMPDSFRVELAPSYPLSIGSALSVRAVRTHGGGRKNDWTFTYWPDGWRRTQAPLSDDEIRACLTPEGPRPATY
jgi:hypothetical protein